MFLNFLQDEHFQIERSGDLEEEQLVSDIVVEQEHIKADFKMFRFCRKALAASSEDVS